MITIDPKEVKVPQLHGLMLAAIAPRPICFASTIDEEGNPNLSPFSFFNVFSSNPPVLVFSPARSGRTGQTKNTLDNVKQVGEVVVNIVTYEIVQQMSLASTEYPKGVDEFVKAGFTKEPAQQVKPFMVKESPVKFECKVREVVELGQNGGAGNLIICDILLMHIDEAVMTDGKIDQKKINLVARLGDNWYCKAFGDALFEVEKPLSTLGIGVDQLPERIRNSSVLTGNNLGQLGNVERIPTHEEVNEYLTKGAILELFEDYKHNKVQLEKELHVVAKRLLDENNVQEAWKVLMASL